MPGPCVGGWTVPTGLCTPWAAASAAQQDYATRTAIFVLWAATGRRYGPCPRTVRPCRVSQENLYATWPVGDNGNGYWGLAAATGGVTLLGGTCGCTTGCACTPSQITLPGPVASVTSVQVDGVTLASNAYLVQGDRLVRASGSTWPTSQDYGLVDGSVGTWSVTYQQGIAVPDFLNDAAGRYACEILKGVTGGSCQLPGRVQSLTRQGVDVQFLDSGDYLDKGRTGLADVDQIITALNPARLPGALRVLSPDLPQYR